MRTRFFVWVDERIVETTMTAEEANYYARAFKELQPESEIKIEQLW